MNIETLLEAAGKVNLPLQAEKLEIVSNCLKETSLLKHIEDFNPTYGWVQTADAVITKDFVHEIQGQWIEHAELVNEKNETLQIHQAADHWQCTLLIPGRGDDYLYLTEQHALRDNPAKALTYRVYFKADNTRTPCCARLVLEEKE